MEPLQRVAFVCGIIAGLTTITAFVLRFPNPLNYSLLIITAVVLIIAALWHKIAKSTKDKTSDIVPKSETIKDASSSKNDIPRSQKLTLYNKRFVVAKKEYEPFDFKSSRGDIVSISVKADDAFNWYILDDLNFDKYERGLTRFDVEDSGMNTIEEEQDFRPRKSDNYSLVIENAVKNQISVSILMSILKKS